MKFARFSLALMFFVPCASFGAASSGFQNAAKLLAAARRGDTQTIQALVNAGADVNYVDSTGLSVVCTAVLNNDTRAIQVLQMYGADASNCDKQIKNYKQKSKRAASGEEYGFFSGLSSSHMLALSAIGVAGVIGGVALLSDVFDDGNSNSSSSSGGGHGGGGGGGGSGADEWSVGPIPYGPAYLTSTGAVNTGFDLSQNLVTWDTGSHSSYFDYLRIPSNPATYTESYFLSDKLNPRLQNYLLMMGGYYSLASYYFGQVVFRNSVSHVPLLSENGHQKQPIRVALITGNGINPAGSAGFGDGIVYTTSTAVGAEETRVDKYVNNTLNKIPVGENDVIYSHEERPEFDLSGSGTVFNPFANVNESALAKIVGGWEAGGNPIPDLYGFVPNAQLAIFRTGNGSYWNVIENATSQTPIGTFTDGGTTSDPDGKLSVGDVININGQDYDIVAPNSLTNPTISVNGTEYKLSVDVTVFVAQCPDGASNCRDFAIYVGTDGAWYVNINGGTSIDAVYTFDGDNIFNYRSPTSIPYQNFVAMQAATGIADVIANTNILPASRDNSYTTIGTFKKEAALNNVTDLSTFYSNKIDAIYGDGQGGNANYLFNNYKLSKPMLIMPAGEYVFLDSSNSGSMLTLDATFENYAPLLYGNNLNHNFMTVIAVSHDNGTTYADTISDYANGTGSQYGRLNLSIWQDTTDNTVYQSRKCGIAGVGSGSVDPWCFAAAGPTPEMATASAAGAVASVKSAFDYMDNGQIFTLLALTADGPYLGSYTEPSSTVVTPFTTDSLAEYLQLLYDMPGEYDTSSLSSSEYLDLFKQVYGYGLINLERAIRPGRAVHYYSDGKIISSPYNAYWRSGSTVHASNVLSLSGQNTIKTSYYDVLESVDGALSLPRVWNDTITAELSSRHGLYMGDVLGDFDIDSNRTKSERVGKFDFSMSMSPRAYNDNMNGLDNLRVAFVSNDFDVAAEYQNHLTDYESRFNGRANGLLALASNAMSSDVRYKSGDFSFGMRAFNGSITDESLLENDPVVSSQYEPARLGFVNGGAFDTKYSNNKFAFDMSVGIMNETNTVLGMYSDGLLYLNGAKTQYVDTVATYNPTKDIKLSARATFANTAVNEFGGVVSEISDIKSNAFAFGLDIGGFGLTIAAPLAVVDGRMGYDYAEFSVVENDVGGYEIVMNNPHIEYVDMAAKKRELRFTTSYKKSLGALTDAGVEFMYRLNPNNIDTFGNESILMFKLRHRVGI